MLFTRLASSLKNWVAPAAILGMGLFTLGLAPTVYDTHAPDIDGIEDVVYADTTYDDGRFVILKTVTCVAGLCSFEGPDPNDFSVRYKYDWTQSLVFTWETGFGDAVDSASVDSIWEAWGYDNPQAYALSVPGAPFAGPDTVGSYYFVNFDDYTSTLDFKTNPDDWFHQDTVDLWFNPEVIFLDTVESYNPFVKSLRLDWVYDHYCSGSGDLSGCDSRSINAPIYYDTFVTKIYGEMAFRFDSSDTGMSSGCTYYENWFKFYPDTAYTNIDPPCAWKWVQNTVTPAGGRWQIHIFSGGANGPDGNWEFDTAAPSAGANGWNFTSSNPLKSGFLVDNEWHVLRWLFANSTDSLTYDGEVVIWVDDSVFYDAQGANDTFTVFNESRMYNMSIGRNKDHGGDFIHTESYWIGYITLWSDNVPDWYTDPSP